MGARGSRNGGVTNPLHKGSRKLTEQQRAQKNLTKINQAREGKKFRLVQTGHNTWIEEEIL